MNQNHLDSQGLGSRNRGILVRSNFRADISGATLGHPMVSWLGMLLFSCHVSGELKCNWTLGTNDLLIISFRKYIRPREIYILIFELFTGFQRKVRQSELSLFMQASSFLFGFLIEFLSEIEAEHFLCPFILRYESPLALSSHKNIGSTLMD